MEAGAIVGMILVGWMFTGTNTYKKLTAWLDAREKGKDSA